MKKKPPKTTYCHDDTQGKDQMFGHDTGNTRGHGYKTTMTHKEEIQDIADTQYMTVIPVTHQGIVDNHDDTQGRDTSHC